MSTSPRKVVVAPVVGDRSGLNPLTIIPIWIVSAVVHGAILLLFSLVTWDMASADEQKAPTEIKKTTELKEAEKEPDLTNPDFGVETDKSTNYDIDRKDDVSVPGPANLTEAVGVVGAPPDVAPSTIPPPPGTGGGGGGAPVMTDPGIGSMAGLIGGMGGMYNPGGFGGRSGATRAKLLQEGGGNEISEKSVADGLLWLALHQANDGHWSLHEFNRTARRFDPGKNIISSKTFVCNCGGMTTRQNDIAATAFGLLPFLASGITHKPSGKKAMIDYTKTVAGGLNFLMYKQGKDGYFGGDMYAHGLATIALCEAYGLTSDPKLKRSAQRALDFIVYAQDTVRGGWRYSPRSDSDTSVTGWQLMAIKSGQMSNLKIPRKTIYKVEQYLSSCETSDKGGFGYVPGSGETYTMTSVGLLCRQYLGASPRNPSLLKGVKRLKAHPPGSTGNIYYEYYATQVMHHMGGESWQFWNLGPDGKSGIRDTLIKKQDNDRTGRKQHQRGSWDPASAGVGDGGRMMSTSLSLLCLEVYYRHLPLYRREMGVSKDAK